MKHIEGYLGQFSEKTKAVLESKSELKAVSLQKALVDAENLYVQLFTDRYGVEPVALDPGRREKLREMISSLGHRRFLAVLEQYFSMKGNGPENQWFLIKAHDVYVLFEHLNAVLIALSAQARSQPRALRIKAHTICLNAKCTQPVLFEGPASEIGNVVCADCQKNSLQS